VSERQLKITLEYDGAGFHGWQIQPGQLTVQGALEKALTTVLRRPVSVMGQGRTDSGVHAAGQVAHALLDSDETDLVDLRRRLNGLLGPSCAVRELSWAPDGFHARYSAIERQYRYQITREPAPLLRNTHWLVEGALDLESMRAAMPLFTGEHDFGCYCSHSREMVHTRCVVSAFTLGEYGTILTFRIAADRFLHNMIRRIVGELVQLARGKIDQGTIEERIGSPGPADSGLTAPPHGLILEQVVYP
jgi:tRNA pseudouridine38-40 synthase